MKIPLKNLYNVQQFVKIIKLEPNKNYFFIKPQKMYNLLMKIYYNKIIILKNRTNIKIYRNSNLH